MDPRDKYEIGDETSVAINRYQLLKTIEVCRAAIDPQKLESYFALKALLLLEVESAVQLDGRQDYDSLKKNLIESLKVAPWPKSRRSAD